MGLKELLAVLSPDPVLPRKQLCSFLPIMLEKQNFFHIFHKTELAGELWLLSLPRLECIDLEFVSTQLPVHLSHSEFSFHPRSDTETV